MIFESLPTPLPFERKDVPFHVGRPRRSQGLFDLIDQLFIIRALVLRMVALKYQRYGRVGFLGEFIMPIFIILLHYYVFLALARYMPAEIPVELFVFGGFTVWFAARNTAAKVTRRGEGGFGPIYLPGITQTHFLFATAAWECAAMIFLLYGSLAVMAVFGANEPLPNLLPGILVFVITVALGTGARLVFEAIGSIWPLANGIKKLLLFLSFLTSGIYSTGKPYGAEDILTQISWYNPLFHLLDRERGALWPGYPLVETSYLYPIAWALGLLALGTVLNRRLRPWTRT
jgi:ABC-type polysaccharide/polyol phosphate export permease